jgi:mannose/fructose/N-acetylgalactosamine-specific phosphotransferase system component IIC
MTFRELLKMTRFFFFFILDYINKKTNTSPINELNLLTLLTNSCYSRIPLTLSTYSTSSTSSTYYIYIYIWIGGYSDVAGAVIPV